MAIQVPPFWPAALSSFVFIAPLFDEIPPIAQIDIWWADMVKTSIRVDGIADPILAFKYLEMKADETITRVTKMWHQHAEDTRPYLTTIGHDFVLTDPEYQMLRTKFRQGLDK